MIINELEFETINNFQLRQPPVMENVKIEINKNNNGEYKLHLENKKIAISFIKDNELKI